MEEALGKEELHRNHYFYTNELLKQLDGLLIRFYQEARIEGHHVVQCMAQKPIDRDAMKYNLFNMHTAQKDEGKSRQIELAEKLFKGK